MGRSSAGRFLNDLRSVASDIPACLDADDPLVTRLWPCILMDMWKTDADDDGRASREAFLRDLPLSKPGEFKGPKASTSRWYSFLHSQRFWDDTWHTKLMLLVWVALRKGWAQEYGDIFALARSAKSAASVAPLPALVDASAADLGAQVGRPSGPGSASASSGGGLPEQKRGGACSAGASAPPALGPTRLAGEGEAAPSSKAAAMASGKEAVDVVRRSSANTLHAVARMMGNPDFLSHIRLVAMATKAFAKSHGDAASEMGPAESNMRFYASWAHWSSGKGVHWLRHTNCLQCQSDSGGGGGGRLVCLNVGIVGCAGRPAMNDR